MEEILTIIMEHVTIWAPSLVAIFGTVFSIVLALGKLNEAINNFRADHTLADVNSKLKQLTAQNAELIRCNKLLLDKITKIKGYADHKEE